MQSLSEFDRHSLLKLAREAVTAAVSRGETPSHIPCDGVFAEKCGVFVTLHVRGRLRGCIGVVEPSEPLGEAITRCAASASLEDSRFPPMRPGDLPFLHIELSLLSPPAAISLELL